MKWLVQGWRSTPETPCSGKVTDTTEPARSGSGEVILLAFWLGIVVGLSEVASLVAARRITGRITYETLRTNWHYAWMIPVSYLILFGTVGLVLGLLRRVSPSRFGFRTAVYVLSFLAALAGVMAIPRIHGLALFVLAGGLAIRLGSWATRWWGGLDRVVRVTMPVLVVACSGLIAWQMWAVARAEERALASLPEAPVGVPNVLLIVLDTVRFDGVFPEPPARDPTPFLTRLSARGIRFDEARSTAPWTLPSHASMFTGRWPHELSTGVGRPLDSRYPTLAEHLARHGDVTAAFMGNTHNGNAWYGLNRGFARYEDHYENTSIDAIELLRASRVGSAFLCSKLGQRAVRLWIEPPDYMYRKSAAMINRDALAWIERQKDRPFFAVLNYYDAHDPYIPPSGVPRPFSSLNPPNDPRPPIERARDMYDDCLAYLDGQLEGLFDELEDRGVLKHTVVVITADHGEGFGEHRLQGHGISLYRQELHVPLLVVFPSGHAGGRQVNEPVSLRDIPATVAELTGTQARAPFPGRSLSRYWWPDMNPGPHDAFLSEVEPAVRLDPTIAHAPTGRGAVTAVFTNGHVFIRNGDGEEELYDLDDDPQETVNKAAHPAHDPPIAHFRSTLDRLLERAGGDGGYAEVP